MAIPHSAQELRERIPLLHESDIVANVTYQSIMTLTTAATRIADALPEYAERVIDTSFAPRHRDVRTFPVSSKVHMTEGFVIFDDVFVPNERIFLDGATQHKT